MTAPALSPFELEAEAPQAINPFEVNREATRYIWWAGDLMMPGQKRQRPDLALGGEYFGQMYKTLRRSRGLLRRCQITPMEIAYDFMTPDMIGDSNLDTAFVVPDSGVPGTINQPLHAIKVYPGDEIKGITAESHSDSSKGYAEITQLQGVDFNAFQESGLQNLLFPFWQDAMNGRDGAMPSKLSGIEAVLRTVDTADANILEIRDTMLISCDAYRNWGMNYLKIMTQLVKTPVHQGFTHTYSPIAEMLFDQLEVRREDLLSKESDIADILSKVNAGSASNDDMMKLIARMADTQELLAKIALGEKPAGVTTEQTFSMGDTVTYLDGEAKIVGKPGGKLTLELTDGSKVTVSKEEVNK